MTLNWIRSLPEADEVVARVDPEAIKLIEGRRSLTWISTTPLDQLATALLEVVGPDNYKTFFARRVNSWSESKLFGPLTEAASRIFGTDPTGHLKWLGRAWQITTRNMGSVETTPRDDGRLRIEYGVLPPCHRMPRMVYSSEGSIRGVIEARGKTPLIDVDDSRLASEGRMAFDVGWSD